MARKTMERDARKDELLKAAKTLFDQKGFEATSIDDIVQSVGVAKGLFYYYFRSKDAVLEVLVERVLADMEAAVDEVSRRDGLSAMERIDALFEALARIKKSARSVTTYFHKPQNRYMHLDLQRRGLECITPVAESIIRQGNDEGIFNVSHPRETAVCYLAASSALGHLYGEEISDEEIGNLVKAYQEITERLLGAKPGTFDLYWRHFDERPVRLKGSLERCEEGRL